MITLANAAQLTKKTGKWAAIGFGALIGIIILFQIGGVLKNALFPSPVPPPEVSFGKLNPVVFPQSPVSIDLSFSVDTVSGELPVLPDRVNVIKTKAPRAELLSLTKAREKVAKAGFALNETKLSDSIYQWTDKSSLSRTISMNIFTSDFKINSAYTSNKQVIDALSLKSEQDAKAKTLEFLSSMEILPEDIDEEKTKTTLLRIENGTVVPATSLSAAQLIRVELFQKDIEELHVFYPANVSTMRFLLGSGLSEPEVVEADFSHHDVSDEKSTYPIITSQQGFEALKNKQAYIASYNGKDSNVSIKEVELGYYVGEARQGYMAPVIVFKGDDGFIAYVPAVAKEWIQN